MKNFSNIWKKFGPLILVTLLLIMVPVGMAGMGVGFTNTIGGDIGITVTENHSFASIVDLYNASKNSIIGNIGVSKPLKDMYFLGVFAFVFLALTIFSVIILTFQDKLVKVSMLVKIAKVLSGLFALMTILLAVSYYGVFMNKLNFYNLKFSGATIAGLTLIIVTGLPTVANSAFLVFKK